MADQVVISREHLHTLIQSLAEAEYDVIGPRVVDGAIAYDTLDPAKDLPSGYSDEQDGGKYRLVRGTGEALFDYVLGPHSWKRYLYPPEQLLWRAKRHGKGFRVEEESATPRYAFIGVRPCEIRAMQVHDQVFVNDEFSDPGYEERRRDAFIVAVNCARPGGTCFCASMGSGPKAAGGYDLALTELLDAKRHVFLVDVGTKRGSEILAAIPSSAAQAADIEAAAAISEKAAAAMGREMPEGVADLLKRNLENRHWNQIATRCLNCANCTMVCPTCFCSTMEDVTDLGGDNAERWRKWDSCFSIDFSYIHGGSIRRDGASRYRQWMTHKLSTWFDQFGTSGCVGCGRCITWCPVGIDITQEAREIRAAEDGKIEGRE
jgi:sulfhydrogenase subunit beta (sulfur reductase)